ncbi:hypothetical protein EMCRGX_G004532 [Ephydatia muelleri]
MQQVEAAKKKKRGVRWHPLIIRWCLYWRHRSSGAYEALMNSGCIVLPSQRTLRDYTHFFKELVEFSVEVDRMLMEAVHVETCPEREKLVVLLMDEMYIREDIVYEKHSGKMIGFSNLGSVNNHLLQFEQNTEMSSTIMDSSSIAKTMLVFMVRGMFTKLQFCYAQFPCSKLTVDQLYDLFWEAVGRIENCGLKCDNKYISWDHLKELYDADVQPGIGIRIVPKLKLEHIQLSAFSKMCVDLAAQVCSESVSKALPKVCDKKAYETATFVSLMDKFFDTLNVHNYSGGSKTLKPFQAPFRSPDDFRIKAIRVIGSFCQNPKYGNCRGSNSEQSEDVHVSLPKRRRIRGTKSSSANQELDDTLSGAIEWDPSNNNAGLLCRAISDMKHNKSHSLPTVSSEVAMQIGSTLLEWMPYHVVETDAFVSWLFYSVHELIETDGENPASTAEWLNAINCGGLFCINDVTFDFFVALEYEVRSHIHARQELGVVRSELQQSEDVLFHWSLIAATWDDEVAAKWMTMIVELWVTIFMRMGLPRVLTTDNGSEFKNKLNAEMMKLLGIRQCHLTPYHSQANGLDERFNQTLQRMLVKAITGQNELWDEFIDSAVFAYLSSCHESSCYAPFEVMFGRKAVLPFDVDLKSVSLDKLLC